MAQDKKVYIGKAKKIQTQYGSFITGYIIKEKIEQLDGDFIGFRISQLQTPDKKGNTHTIILNDRKTDKENWRKKKGNSTAQELADEISPPDLDF